MRTNLIEFFQDDGNKSLIRLLSFMLVVAGILIGASFGGYDLYKNSGANMGAITLLSTSLIGLGLGAKVVQKKDEIKVEANKV